MAAAKTERLLNLVIALLSTRRALSKAAIRDRVAAYRSARSDEAFERMFERDKDELRELGIPLVTEALDEFFDDEPAYRIDRAEYALPDLSMSPEQLALLGLAGRTWAQASLGADAARALRKLEAVVDPDEVERAAVVPTGLEHIEARVGASEPAFETVRSAVVTSREVTFDYRSRRAPTTRRRVQPWGIAAWHGHWYLTGHDLDRQAPRVFRLDRIEGSVTAGPPGSYGVPDDHDPRTAIIESLSSGAPVSARLRVRPGRGHALRRRADSPAGAPSAAPEGWDLVAVTGHDLDSFADEIVGYGADVVVDAPQELRRAVVERLRAVWAAHDGEVSA